MLQNKILGLGNTYEIIIKVFNSGQILQCWNCEGIELNRPRFKLSSADQSLYLFAYQGDIPLFKFLVSL